MLSIGFKTALWLLVLQYALSWRNFGFVQKDLIHRDKFISNLIAATLGCNVVVGSTFSISTQPVYAAADYSSSTVLSSTRSSKLDIFLPQAYEIKTADGKLKQLSIAQGFGAMKGKTPAKDGGDRTGSYLWRGGVEFGNILVGTGNKMDSSLSINVQNKRVIDLGTGTGIVGISALLQGAREVALTDGAKEIVELAAYNIQNNFPRIVLKTPSTSLSSSLLKQQQQPQQQSSISSDHTDMIQEGYSTTAINHKQHVGVGQLRWSNDQDIQTWLHWGNDENRHSQSNNKNSNNNHNNIDINNDGIKKYDVVLASEVFYQRQSIDKLLDTMKQLVKPSSEGGMIVLRLTPELTDEARGFDTYLLPRMKELGIKYTFLDSSVIQPQPSQQQQSRGESNNNALRVSAVSMQFDTDNTKYDNDDDDGIEEDSSQLILCTIPN